ncbi:hypothetical protein K4L44_08340 [Halosquirtibacter laminarini]|uniref:Uncharacterized protein n=1 Tax=Halosquirtibacter laminarini TaxID=3374600 RepID=A0AC61NMQ7_9BACT|nr:hypothetical protein K4L44_08340 [Prolixibacteraceae bacterium]
MNGEIQKVTFRKTYKVNGIGEVIMEQEKMSLESGDSVVSCTTGLPLPNGDYRFKGKLFRVSIEDNMVV